MKPAGQLDTLALACFRTGDASQAVETEHRALKLLPADTTNRADYERPLAKLESFVSGQEKLEMDQE